MGKLKLYLLLLVLFVGNLGGIFAQDFWQTMELGSLRDVRVRIPLDELRQEGIFWVWEPNRGVRRASYETYYLVFPQGSPGIPSTKTNVIDLSLRLTLLSPETYEPTNPQVQAPQGGFRYYRYLGIVLPTP